MRKIVLTLIAVLVLCVSAQARIVLKETKEFDDQKFKTVITITYNAITLEQAQIVEAFVKNKFNDACKIDVELNDISNIQAGNLLIADDYTNTVYYDTFD